jgi:tryptophanyl-tRNA synthetase
MKTVLSCIQPTGDLHLGNYFGAVQNWVNLQGKYKCIYGVVDCHSMTMPYKATDLKENTWKMVFQLLACGIKPENLFIQSLVPEHTELAWYLSCVTSYGELQKMTQFKDKREQLEEKDNQAFISTGLFFYPVLQAADILIYQADYVPVGKDQEQHLELSRNIAARFNHQFGKDFFAHPEPLFTEIPKLLSPADPTKKMSKSLGEKHYINLFGEDEAIRKQIKKAVTDATPLSFFKTSDLDEAVLELQKKWNSYNSIVADKNHPHWDNPTIDFITEEDMVYWNQMSIGVKNLFEILKACKKYEIFKILFEKFTHNSLQYGELKTEVGEALVELVTPFRERLSDLKSRENEVKEQIRASSAEIRKIAQKTIREVKELTGIMNV